MTPLPFYLAGPTGCGKSAVALELARRSGGEIVNADAFQVYREFRILTARPSESDERKTPHHLYGVLSVSESCDAGRYLSLAKPVLAEIASRGRLPIVIGGSGLYLKALTHGVEDVPVADPAVRDRLNALSDSEIVAELQKDPTGAASVDLANRRYTQRALEIFLSSGHSVAKLRQAWKTDSPELRGVFLNRPRAELYDRINQRVLDMLETGAMDEVSAVGDWSDTAEKAIGVREIGAQLAGELSRDDCIAAIQQNSRRYAKRQITWFRREKWLAELEIQPHESPAAVTECIVAQFPDLNHAHHH